MIVTTMQDLIKHNSTDLKKIGVVIEVPDIPFPTFPKDESLEKYGAKHFEQKCAEQTNSQFFWITGLFRENYDLIYPYLLKGGKKIKPKEAKSASIYNYDIIARSIDAQSGKYSQAREILSGAIREWLYEPIVERIIDHKVLPEKPVVKQGNIENIESLGGYGPFLYYTAMKNKQGKPFFPETMGGGIGVERTVFTILEGEKIKKIDDITCFGKNPDSHPIFLF